MFYSVFHKCKNLYFNTIPTMICISGTSGLLTGVYANCVYANSSLDKDKNEMIIDIYTNLIGYTTLGVLTGITYPISAPLCLCYMLKTRNISKYFNLFQ